MAPMNLMKRSVPSNDSLPRVDFRRVASVGPRAQAGQNEKVNESYGFNSTQNWDAPESYIKWLQPIEADLSKQVEYDMDDIDQEWLDAVNAERRKEGLDAVSYEFFEVLMDRLEKEWFELSARIPKPASAMAVEDSKCAICDDGECENSNAIVFCDGCNLAVHQDCYGVPYIPEGQWLCRKCTVSPDKPVTCVLCPSEGGAFKQTTTGGWAHLLCAIWVPETGVSNTIYMEPVDGVENIPKSRWKLICYLCKKRVGAPIQCSNRACFTAFHVTCARDYGLHLKLKVQTADYKAFCHKHEPKEMGAIEVPLIETLTEDEGNLSGSQATRKRKRGEEAPPPPKPEKKIRATPKSSRAYSKTFAQGPPIIPFYIHTRLWEYVDRIRIRNKKAFVAMACRYWSLKREARRGAPLLKRLHLEPWTAAAANGQQSEAEKRKKLKLINRLRADLENVRMLCELVKKREKEKLRRAQLLKALVDDHVFPYTAILRVALQKIVESDKSKVFAKPVDRSTVPDYYEVISKPMDWNTMSEKLERHEYGSAQELADDVELVLANAMTYNKKETPFYKAAQRVQKAVEPILEELKANDDPASAFQRHAAELMRLLNEDTIEAFHDVDYLLPKSPSPPIKESPKSAKSAKKRKEETVSSPKHKEEPAPSPSRKRTRSGGAVSEPEPEPEETKEGSEAEVDAAAQAKKDARNAARRQARKEARERREADKARKAESREKTKARRPQTEDEAESDEEEEDDEVLDDEVVGDDSLTVKDVTPHASFLSFNTGWILPSGSRRRKDTPEPAPVKSTAPKRPSKLKLEDKMDESEEEESEEEPAERVSTKKGKQKAVDGQSGSSKPRNIARERIVELLEEFAVEEDAELEEGCLLWAKMDAWPYWPAEAVDPDGARAPKLIIAQRPDDDSCCLVQFFDPARTWAWIPRERLHMLGDSSELDEAMCSKSQVRDARKRSQVKAALKFATSQMEIDE